VFPMKLSYRKLPQTIHEAGDRLSHCVRENFMLIADGGL
jgi:hypothetical protein